MQTMTPREIAATIIAAALAWRQKYDHDLEKEKADRLMMSSEQRAHTAADVLPATFDDEDNAWESFADFFEREGFSKMRGNVDSNIMCIAGLLKDEPAFTLRGTDKTASIVTKVWHSLQEGLNDDISEHKLDQSQKIIEDMEAYTPQRWAD